jgi:hypothetical protein
MVQRFLDRAVQVVKHVPSQPGWDQQALVTTSARPTVMPGLGLVGRIGALNAIRWAAKRTLRLVSPNPRGRYAVARCCARTCKR